MTALAPRHARRGTTLASLVDAAVDGDEAAWQELCRRYDADVRSVAHARLRDAHAAQDVVQETWLRAWTRLHQVQDVARLGAWLRTIAANAAVDHVRRQRTAERLDQPAHDLPAALPTHDELVVAQEEAARLREHLAELRPVDRSALWQRDGLGVPVAELAEQFEMTNGSVRVLLHRARRRVRDGYALLVVPVLGLGARVRARAAGLGDAIPVAIAAPALVVAGVVGVVVPGGTDAPPPTRMAAVAPAPPAPSVTSAPTPGAPSAAPVTDPVPVTTREGVPRSVARPAPDAAASQEPTVRVGTAAADARVGGAPEEGAESDVSQDTSTGPVEGVDLYVEELGDLGEACVVCD